MSKKIHTHLLSHKHVDDLVEFCKKNKGYWQYFTPFKLDKQFFIDRIGIAKKDKYFVYYDEEKKVVAIGMLRGMDEGYPIPMLGIAIDSDYYGTGLSKFVMDSLEDFARETGYEEIRLKVHKDNIKAIKLYEKLGYSLSKISNSDEFLGVKSLL